MDRSKNWTIPGTIGWLPLIVYPIPGFTFVSIGICTHLYSAVLQFKDLKRTWKNLLWWSQMCNPDTEQDLLLHRKFNLQLRGHNFVSRRQIVVDENQLPLRTNKCHVIHRISNWKYPYDAIHKLHFYVIRNEPESWRDLRHKNLEKVIKKSNLDLPT